MKKRKLVFSVTLKDCDVETFTVGGNGGGGKDTSNTGVRITHRASNAVGRATDSRSQLQNKRLAFKRMAETSLFKGWIKLEAARRQGVPSIEAQVDEMMESHNLKVEQFRNGRWEIYEPSKGN